MATATQPSANGGVVATQQKASLIATMAGKAGLDPKDYFEAVKATVFDSKGSKEELIAFLTVANKYNLNPFTKEIYAFPKKGGGIQPIVSIDGWANIINSHHEFNGMEFIDNLDDKADLVSITCRIHRKDRQHPIECTEYMAECKRATDPWKTWPRRMLRHKAMIQAARYAFGLAGIMDPDEAERAESVGWSQPQGKVGVSEVNKLLEKMPAHKPAETPQDAEDFVDAEIEPEAEPAPKTKPAAKPGPAEAEADAATMRMLLERLENAETPMELNQVRDDIGALSLGKHQRMELDAVSGRRQKELK